MPRLPRKYSENGTYHIMVRGNARQDIFIDRQDKEKFIKTLQQKRVARFFNLYAYCVMSNHAHMVVKELRESISIFMKRITTSYAFYFNKKYDRVGHIFQDRFKSEVIKDDSYLLSVIRYVHNNPEKANISNKENYLWSSYHEYISPNVNKLPDISEILAIFSLNMEESIDIFKGFSGQTEKRRFLDIDLKKDIQEDLANHFMEKFLKDNHIEKIDLKRKIYFGKRNDLIRILLEETALSMRSIASVMGINREVARKLSQKL